MSTRPFQIGDTVRVVDASGSEAWFRVGDYAKIEDISLYNDTLQLNFNDSRNARVVGNGFWFAERYQVVLVDLIESEAAGLTQAERGIINLTAELWNATSALPDQHPCDLNELQRDIHNIQNRIMARLARRAHPEVFR